MNENNILLVFYIYLIFTLYQFWNLCYLRKRKSLLSLIFWAPIFSYKSGYHRGYQPITLKGPEIN